MVDNVMTAPRRLARMRWAAVILGALGSAACDGLLNIDVYNGSDGGPIASSSTSSSVHTETHTETSSSSRHSSNASSSGSSGATAADGGPDAAPDGGTDAPPPNYVATVLADTPLAYFRLGEAVPTSPAADEVDGGVTGTYSDAGVALGVPGAIANDPDTAVQLSGGEVDLSATEFQFSAASPFTLEAWVATTDLTNDQEILVKRDYDSTTSSLYGWVLFVAQTTGSVCVERWYGSMSGAQDDMVCSSAFLAIGVYSHVAATYDGASLVVYVDGQMRGTANSSTPLPSAGTVSECIIGDDAFFTPTNVVGSVDEVAIYGAALSGERILAHYQAGIGE